MNSLSWLLYLADVAGNIGWIFTTIFILSAITSIVALVIGAAMLAEEHKPPKPADWRLWRRVVFGAIASFFLSAMASALTPSRETVYAIAASELGEEMIESEIGGKATEAIKAWLDRQIEGPSGEGKDTEGAE